MLTIKVNVLVLRNTFNYLDTQYALYYNFLNLKFFNNKKLQITYMYFLLTKQ